MVNIDYHNNIEIIQGENMNITLKANDYKFISSDKIIFVISNKSNNCLVKKEFNLFEGNKCFIEFSSIETLNFPVGEFSYSIIGYFDSDQVSYLIEDNKIIIKEGLNCLK